MAKKWNKWNRYLDCGHYKGWVTFLDHPDLIDKKENMIRRLKMRSNNSKQNNQ